MQNSNKYKKKLFQAAIIFSTICGSVFPLTGQNADDIEINNYEHVLINQLKTINTLQCAFVQEKTSTLVRDKYVSKGNLFYQYPNALRWEYTDPNISTFILNGNNAVLLGKNDEKLGNEKMLKQLGEIIISLINGNAITQEKHFQTAFYKTENDQIQVVLTPITKRLKDYFTTIIIDNDVNSLLANEIVLYEKSGDKTIISLKNKEINHELSSSMFKIK